MEQPNAPALARVVLSATRFTAACDAAVAVAIEVARQASARLVLVHVLETTLNRQEAQQRLEAAAATAPDVAIEVLVLRGEPGHAIARAAEHAHADVVVIGRGHRSEALIPNGVPDVLARACAGLVLAVDQGEGYASVVRRLADERSPARRCLVCAREDGDAICQRCQNQITADALEGRHRIDKAATRGISG